MNRKDQADWCHLPPGVEIVSLWETLHDGQIVGIRSDLLGRTLSWEVDVPHLRDHREAGPEGHFLIELQGVDSVRITSSAVWPGDSPGLAGKSRDVQHALVVECQSKWREVSVGWAEFEAASVGKPFEIEYGEIARDAEVVSLRLGIRMDRREVPSRYFDVITRGTGLIIRDGDGEPIELDRFLEIGARYWRDWSNSQP